MGQTGSRIPFVVIGALILIFIIGAVVSSSGSETKTPAGPPPLPDNARVLLLPADGRTRTVVVPPCGSEPQDTTDDVEAGRQAANAVTAQISPAPSPRVVLVPDCSESGGAGVEPDMDTLAAAAFVLPVGARPTAENRALSVAAQQQVIVPSGSNARSLVVPACAPGKPGGTGEDVVLSPEQGIDTVAAPPC